MGATKEVFMRMQLDHFNELPDMTRKNISYFEIREADEYELHKDDPNYILLKKAERKAKKDVQDYLYNKRHNHKN